MIKTDLETAINLEKVTVTETDSKKVKYSEKDLGLTKDLMKAKVTGLEKDLNSG